MKRLEDFTDAELAAMVRNSLYLKNTTFGDRKTDCRFMLVLAVPYGRDENVDSLDVAMEGFARLLQDDDWKEREFQVYDHEASQHYFAASMEEVEAGEVSA